GETTEPGLVGARQAYREQEAEGLGAHRGEVRQIDGQRLVAEIGRRHAGEEMSPFDQDVAGDGDLAMLARGDQRAVVADAQWRAPGRAPVEETPDQLELAHRRRLPSSGFERAQLRSDPVEHPVD